MSFCPKPNRKIYSNLKMFLPVQRTGIFSSILLKYVRFPLFCPSLFFIFIFFSFLPFLHFFSSLLFSFFFHPLFFSLLTFCFFFFFAVCSRHLHRHVDRSPHSLLQLIVKIDSSLLSYYFLHNFSFQCRFNLPDSLIIFPIIFPFNSALIYQI